MEYISVLLAALAAFVFGAVWYTALSKPWMKAAGIPMKPDGTPDGNGSPMPFVVLAVALILVSGMMRHVMAMSGLDTVSEGLMAGVGVGAFFITPWMAMNNAFGMRPWTLTLIDGGYAIAACTIIGLVLTLL